MRYIKILNNKKHPILKKEENKLPTIKKLEEKKLIITNINKEFKEEQLYLYIVGDNLNENLKYVWEINFDEGSSIYPVSTGSVLILNKANTLKYVKSDKTNVIITVEDYISPTFEI